MIMHIFPQFRFYRPTKSQTFAGTSPNVVDELHNAKWKENEWPSSHWAVITDFEVL